MGPRYPILRISATASGPHILGMILSQRIKSKGFSGTEAGVMAAVVVSTFVVAKGEEGVMVFVLANCTADCGPGF